MVLPAHIQVSLFSSQNLDDKNVLEAGGSGLVNQVNKGQMTKFVGTHGGAGLPDTEIFEIYSAYSILNGLLSENADPFEVHLKGTEFGLDGVAILVQGQLVTNKQECQEALDGLEKPID